MAGSAQISTPIITQAATTHVLEGDVALLNDLAVVLIGLINQGFDVAGASGKDILDTQFVGRLQRVLVPGGVFAAERAHRKPNEEYTRGRTGNALGPMTVLPPRSQVHRSAIHRQST